MPPCRKRNSFLTFLFILQTKAFRVFSCATSENHACSGARVACAEHVRQPGGCKSPAQPDGGEVRANRKGVAVRWGPKEAGSDSRALMDKNRIEAFVVGRAGA